MKKNIYKTISSVLLSLMVFTLIPKNIYADTLDGVAPKSKKEIISNDEFEEMVKDEIDLDVLEEMYLELDEKIKISSDEFKAMLEDEATLDILEEIYLNFKREAEGNNEEEIVLEEKENLDFSEEINAELLDEEIILSNKAEKKTEEDVSLELSDEIDPELEGETVDNNEDELVLDEIDPELQAETTLNYEDCLGLDTITFNDENGIIVDARSALLIEPLSGTVLFEKNPDEQFAPASVTKIMTMLLAMEAVDSGKITLQDKVTCSENAKRMGGSTMLLETGEIRTVEELIKGIAIASGNDAAVAMAEYIGGTEDAFVILMNDRAKELGMTNTVFKNCNGLPTEGHLSTARDIATMSLELLKHKDILNYTGIYMETITEGRHSPIELVNHNKLVRFFEGCDGLKTGYTEEAKYCISATATRNGVRVLTVIMGAPSYKVRNRDASMLMNFGLSKYEGKKLFAKDQDVEEIYLSKNKERFLVAKATEDLVVVIPKGSGLEPSYKLILDSDKDQYKTGDIIGKCEAYLDNNKIGEIELYSDRDVEKAGFFENLKFNISNLFDKGV